MKKITTATPEQWAEIERLRLAVIARQTEQVPYADVRAAVVAQWKRMGHEPPLVLVAPSPLACHLCWHVLSAGNASLDASLRASLGASLRASLDASLGDSLRASLDASLGDSLRASLGDSLRASLDASLGDSLRASLRDSLGASLRASLGDSLHDSLRASLHASLRASLAASLRDSLHTSLRDSLGASLRASLGDSLHDSLRDSLDAGYFSIWWRAWDGWYDGGAILGVQYDAAIREAFRAWCRACPYVFAMPKLAIVSANPTSITWGDNVLHREDGPAVEYADGWRVWSIGGVRVDEQIVMRPETQTIQQINDEKNEEVRRVRIDRWGWMRFLEESGAVVVECGRNDIEGTYEILADTPIGQRLITHCPSTGRRYALGIPGDRVTTREAAQQRLWGDRNITLVGRT